ncbi:MAG: response regulator transcription factor [Chloroflexi bacterium]|nr:response regulator transcription factor [Chloroflexota bacterium]
MIAATSLLIFASSALHREAWRALLGSAPHLHLMGAVGDVLELGNAPAVSAIFVDAPSSRPALAQQIRECRPAAGLLFLVPSYDMDEVLPLLRAGATGCISHDSTAADLARAIIAVGRHELALPPQVASRVLIAMARGEDADASMMEPLTAREEEVLALLASGLTNKDIAQTLFLSVRTVEAHLRNIYGKLGVRSRTEAALWAIKHGYGEK